MFGGGVATRGARRGAPAAALLALSALLASGAIAAAGPVPRQDDAPAPQALPDVARLTDGAGAPALDGGAAEQASVDGDVLAALREDEQVPVIVRLKEQANPAAAASRARASAPRAGRAERARAVVAELQRVAEATQPAVRALLQAEQAGGRARNVKAYWIFNGLAATVSRTALERLARHPSVASVSLDETLELPEPQSAPRLPTWGLEKVNAPKTWGDYGFSGKGVVVGVMDSGVDGGHPALASRWRGRDGDATASWYAATGENYATPGDGHGHGTHVTGSIVGGAPGEIVGVAPDAQWIAVKIFRDTGSTSTSIIHDGFQWMLAPGGDPAKAPDVVNNSWGSAATYSTEFLEDVRAWVAAGIFPAFANGNDGPGTGTVGSPGSFPEAFGVGATDVNDQIASFSSRGPAIWDGVRHVKPQVSAPGHQIYSSWPRQLGEGDYNTISGTSMATPHVTGVVALLLSAKPDLSVEATRELLQSTARQEPHMGRLPNDNYGHGIADAFGAITAARFSGTLTGTVTGPNGPVAATVAIPELDLETTSDPITGFYELVVREGAWDVEVSAYGYVGESAPVVVAAGDELTRDFALAAAPVHTVSGTVTAGGAPVAGARVRVAGTPLAPAYTDAAGAFSLEVAEGTYELGAEATGYARSAREVVVDGDETVSFALTPLGGTIEPEWTEYLGNPQRTGLSGEELAAGALTRAWSIDLSGQVAFASPVIAGGRIYVAFDNGRLNALDADDGETLWTFTTGASFRATPAVADGKLFVGGGDSGVFHALDAATGASLWSYATGDRLTYSAPTVVDGTVYFGTGWGEDNGGWLYALDAATGALRWKSFVGPQVYFAPAVGGGRVYAASYDAQRLAAFDATTGEELWSYARGGDSFAAMPTYDAGRLFVATNNFDTGAGSVLALDASSGDLLWEAEGHGDGAGNAPIPFGDLVIAGSSANNWVVAYDRATGEREWVHPVGAAVSNSQLAADGVIVGGSQQDHRVWALDAYSGELLWEDTVSDNVLSAPALADGRLVVADRSGVVRAYEAPGTVAGTVTTAAGAPLDAEVRIGEDAVRTDPATGAFELPHRPGTYTVEAYAYGYRLGTVELTVRSGQRVEHDFVLAAAADGSLRGTVRDASGSPLEGVAVSLQGTPLAPRTTGTDGSFAFPAVAEGTYTLTATLPGWVPLETDVTVVAGEETAAELTLLRYEIAVTGDHEGALTRLLESKGYRVEATTVAAIADRPGDYRLIVANGSRDDPGEEVFRRFVENADAARVSVLFLDTWGISYGSLLHLSRYLGDPPTTGSNYNDGEVSLVATAAHPLTEGLALGERVEALARNTEYAWFSGYGGRSVADVYVGELGRTAGAGIGYEPRSLSSVHVLLSLHAASPWTGPTTGWTAAAGRVFDNAVRYALDASFGAVAGTVTAAGGGPLAATITALETGDATTAAADGTYRLLLPAGAYTLRVERVGYEPRELPVTVVDGETATVDAELVSSGLGAVTGVVTSAAGGPVAGASVEVLGSGRPAATTGADGRFTVDGVPGGTYDVRATAAGFTTGVAEDVAVVDGEATEIAIELRPALRAAVLGDQSNTITTFLNANEIAATATGWEAVANIDAYDVLVLNNPTDPGEAAFLGYLDAIDAAGKSAIFIEGALSTGGGVRLLRKYFGDPAARDFVSSDGDPFFEPTVPDHPLFAGFAPGARVQVLAGDEWGGYFTGYSGIELARFGTNELGVVGVGAAYEPRTPTSVRLLLSALGASSVANPAAGWSADGGKVFLNALRWAAAPGLGTLAGRVGDAAGDPIAGATVRLAESGIETTTAADGSYELPHAPGAYTVEVSAFGYVAESVPVTLTANTTTPLDVELALGNVGAVAGTVTSAGDLSPQAEAGTPLAGATVRLVGIPRETTTADDGSFTLANVEPGTYTLELAAAEHVRTRIDGIVVTAGETTRRDARLRPSPAVGVIDDCQQTAGCVDKLQAFLAEWGYEPEEIGWGDTARLAELDLVVANLGDFPRLDPGADGLAAFQDAANRAHVPVLWLEQYQRGSIRHLRTYEGDPAAVGEARSRGTVEAEILAEHPLVAGFAVGERVPIVESGGEHTWFTGYSGTTVANLRTGSDGVRGSALAYKGRTASSVDVLYSSFAASFYTWPAVGGAPAELLTPQAERLFHNALNYALDAPPLAAEARGTVRSSAGGTIASTVKVLETGRTYPGRTGDGTFFVPLQPGTWTLEVSAFGHGSEQRTVTVAAGDVRPLDVTLVSDDRGSIAGRVVDEAGAPLEAVLLSLEGTDLSAETGADGRYRIDDVPVGDYELVVRKAGYGLQRLPVTVTTDATTTKDVTLAVSRVVAVAGDYQNRITTFLTENGYAVVQWSFADVQNHVGELGDVGLVILNGSGTQPTAAELSTFLEAAAAAGRSVIFAGQFGNGSIRTLRTTYNDPPTVTTSFAQQQIAYRPTVEHPIFAGFAVGEPVELMRHPSGGTNNQQYEFFLGYSGTELAQLNVPAKGGDLGDGVAFRYTSPTSVHVLLASLGAAVYGAPGERWSADAERIYLNAVDWAMEAAQGQVFGTVTSGGAPLTGARVTAVEQGLAATTGADGSYRLGVPNGTHTIRVSAVGHEPYEQVVEVAEDARVRLDVDLVAIPPGSIAGTVVDDATGDPVAGAVVVLTGPEDGETASDEAGAFRFDELLPGAYEVEVRAPGYLPQTFAATVVSGETATLEARLRGNDVVVLGDVDGVLVDFLRGRGEAAEERSWAELPAAADRYDVVVVNGGDPTVAEFEAALAAADAAGASVIFTGTWGVLNGGLRLLAAHRPDEVELGGHGYREGPVTLTGYDGSHRLFRGLSEPLAPLAPDSHFSWLDSYVGPYLARIAVGAGGDRGVSVAYDWRSAGGLHLLLSAGAVSDFVGPGYGWTADGEQLFLNAIEWARDAEQEPPAAPTLATEAPALGTESRVELTGTAEFRSAVTILRDGTPVATATPARDGSFSASVTLVEGPNSLTAVARNHAGDSPASAALVLTLDTTGPTLAWTPADHTGFFRSAIVVSGTATDAHAGVEEVLVNGEEASLTAAGAFAADVELPPGPSEITVVARDRLGNETTERRTVAFFAYTAAWQTAGEKGGGTLQAILRIRDASGTLVVVDSVVAELVDADGTVVASQPMTWEDGKYLASLGRPDPGTYTLRGTIVEDGFAIGSNGPTVVRAGAPVRP